MLAQAQGIPAEGAGQLLRQDALTEGPKLFARYCASCHRYGGTDSAGKVPSEAATASDLKGFGSREWLRGLHDSDKIDSPAYFGGTKWRTGRMVKFVKEKVADFSTQEKADLQKVLAAVSADAGLKSQRALDAASAAEIKAGGDLLRDSMQCADCHQFHTKDDNASGPDLTGWASREWMIALVSNPKSLRFYGALNDRMPAFGEDKKLDPESIALIVDWLRGEWYESPARR